MTCKYCNGKGFYFIPNGDEDVDKELCEYCDPDNVPMEVCPDCDRANCVCDDKDFQEDKVNCECNYN